MFVPDLDPLHLSTVAPKVYDQALVEQDLKGFSKREREEPEFGFFNDEQVLFRG